MTDNNSFVSIRENIQRILSELGKTPLSEKDPVVQSLPQDDFVRDKGVWKSVHNLEDPENNKVALDKESTETSGNHAFVSASQENHQNDAKVISQDAEGLSTEHPQDQLEASKEILDSDSNEIRNQQSLNKVLPKTDNKPLHSPHDEDNDRSKNIEEIEEGYPENVDSGVANEADYQEENQTEENQTEEHQAEVELTNLLQRIEGNSVATQFDFLQEEHQKYVSMLRVLPAIYQDLADLDLQDRSELDRWLNSRLYPILDAFSRWMSECFVYDAQYGNKNARTEFERNWNILYGELNPFFKENEWFEIMEIIPFEVDFHPLKFETLGFEDFGETFSEKVIKIYGVGLYHAHTTDTKRLPQVIVGE